MYNYTIKETENELEICFLLAPRDGFSMVIEYKQIQGRNSYFTTNFRPYNLNDGRNNKHGGGDSSAEETMHRVCREFMWSVHPELFAVYDLPSFDTHKLKLEDMIFYICSYNRTSTALLGVVSDFLTNCKNK